MQLAAAFQHLTLFSRSIIFLRGDSVIWDIAIRAFLTKCNAWGQSDKCKRNTRLIVWLNKYNENTWVTRKCRYCGVWIASHIPKPERCVAQRKGLFREPASASHYSEDRVSVLHALLSYKLSTFCEMWSLSTNLKRKGVRYGEKNLGPTRR